MGQDSTLNYPNLGMSYDELIQNVKSKIELTNEEEDEIATRLKPFDWFWSAKSNPDPLPNTTPPFSLSQKLLIKCTYNFFR